MTIEGDLPPGLGEFRGESFQRGHAPSDLDLELANLVFVLDVQESLPSVRRLRDWALEALAPQPGETAVDLGCGTGAEVIRMAGLVGPEGRAVGVEPHPGLRMVAGERAAAQASGAEFVDGDASSLPFADGSVDVLRCERVFQHLPDPLGATREIARVLGPVGRAVIIDSDWSTATLRPGDPDVVHRLMEHFRGRTPNPLAGRDLRVQLQAAGLDVDDDIGSTAVIFPDFLLVDPSMLRTMTGPAVDDGVVTTEEADELERTLVEAARAGEAFYAVTMFAVLGRKPA